MGTGSRWIVTALMALPALAVGTACSDTDGAEPQGVREDAAAPSASEEPGREGADRVKSGPGPWSATSTGGSEVYLHPPGSPLRSGVHTFLIEVPDGSRDRVVTADLVSPEMPMHGVVRYAAEALGGGRWELVAELPMEGRWVLYVNLDDGSDAAGFAFDVAPGEGDHGHDHGSAVEGDTASTSASDDGGHMDHGSHEEP